MGTNKREIIIDSNMTISELCMLYLDDKYGKVSLLSYSDYNSKIKIINEYMGHIKLKHFNKKMIESLKNYLEKEKQWNFTENEEVSKETVGNVVKQLKDILKQAINWGLLDNDYNCILDESTNEIERINLNRIYEKEMGEKKRALADRVGDLLNSNKGLSDCETEEDLIKCLLENIKEGYGADSSFIEKLKQIEKNCDNCVFCMSDDKGFVCAGRTDDYCTPIIEMKKKYPNGCEEFEYTLDAFIANEQLKENGNNN